MFAWKRFLDQRGFPYREGGKYEILVHCPFCGENDPSQHLSISLRGRGWRCLRVSAHKGKSYARLTALLLGCSEEYARELLGERAKVLPSEDTFKETWRRQLGIEERNVEGVQSLDFPQEFKPLLGARGQYAGSFWRYLHDRGFSQREADWLADRYRLQYTIAGPWKFRLVIPVYGAGGDLQTWVARAINSGMDPRYKNLPKASSVESAPNLLLGLDFLGRYERPRCLVVTEGPFDAMAISALGHSDGIWGTCLFGVQLSNTQTLLLDALSRKFDRVRLLVDPDAVMKVLAFQTRLPRNCEIRHLSQGLKDPGEMPFLRDAPNYLKELVL